MNIDDIIHLLPHDYPFLLIDRVLAHDPGKSIVVLKNVTFNEPFFPGHFPGRPLMPGVLIVEAMAQASSILGLKMLERDPEQELLFYLVGIDNARFKKPVEPGDQLIITSEFVKSSRGISWFKASVSVDDKLVAKAEVLAALREAEA